ncbi:DUF4402 domain-containing protein [Flavobacterium weaverense]|uniref:Uncharacterized protein DUF4402 n=1 Tax=Flavobacterium weaverense TaxID=271156 RepID=A0A3M0A4G1_9FLAO|nr:DUF4402 domain-containing protein [Flavobacterium weaverense]RMA77678.1 uncharacterized protein DUF4402 [Flavobacterium weaverense]
MNKIKFLAILAIAAFSNIANAQSSATASATATIVTPISITNTADMSFGMIAVNGSAGTVILSSDGGTIESGVTLQTGALSTPAKAAGFDVAGTANYGYSITIPTGDVTLTNPLNSSTMTISRFTSSLVGGKSTLNDLGKSSFTVGGTLNVAAGQVAGVYKNDKAITVTVNYN